MTGLHPRLIKSHPDKTKDQVDFPFFEPTLCINAESCHEGSVPVGVKTTKGVPPGLVFKFISKLSVQVAPFRKKADNTLRKETSTIEATVGIDTITLDS
jgi:hypothetical protein